MAEWENVGKIQGEKGEKGDKGDRGAKGDKGDKGTDGKDSILDHNISGDDGYIRYDNGIQICWGILEIEEVEMTSTGEIYFSDTFSWDFPESFISPAVVTVDVNKTNSWATRSAQNAKNLLSFRILSAAGGDKTEVTAHIIAIGRWK